MNRMPPDRKPFPAPTSSILACVVFICSTVVASSSDIEFQRDVLPLLSEHCIDCHGPDEAESMLRLDSPVGALRGGDSGEPVVVPGKSQLSHLISRVTSDDSRHRMPPETDRLTDKQIRVLQSWIDDKTLWTAPAKELATQKIDHWSFQPLRRPNIPDANRASPIDAFIQARLKNANLAMSSPATRRRLIRRLYLVMHGLPPTPEQVERFVDEQNPNAWERLVDKVLESPKYGERWATFWLDLVRFGETHGFETNRERPNAWHYRDWVINAFNDDKPYNRFIIEQIAGDAVGENAATGYLVAGPYDLVKGQDTQLQLVQRQDELADIINTTGTAFLGLTIGCARCHNHKFDPISQTDFYSLQAVFAGVNHADRALPLSTENKRLVAGLDGQIAAAHRKLKKFVRHPTPAQNSTKPIIRSAVTATKNVESFAPVSVRFVRFTIKFTNGGEPCIDELEIFADDRNVALAGNGAKASSSGDFVHPLHKLKHINDGQYGNPHSWISAHTSGGWIQIELPETTTVNRIVWARDREGRYKDRLATDYQIESSINGKDWQPVADSANRLPFKLDAPAKQSYDFAAFSKKEAADGQRLLNRLKTLNAQREKLSKQKMVYAGTFSQPGPTHRLYRGDPTTPRETVVPAAIGILSDIKLAADSPEQTRRLAIADWIASEQNPLTARVLVNRLWQFHFGTGIVDTPSDFGGNGTAPTHPKLLDWLAVEFVANGWSIKTMHRKILLSATWQQDSRPQSEGLAADAGSRMLWRFPPRRLEAEGIRDCMLAATGMLNPQMGGPGFSAFEVEAENVRHYFPKTKFGPADWRRMIYMTKVRQERESVFGVFDCPDYSQVVPKRNRSTTPLQALNLLNSRFVMQQADFLVERLNHEARQPEQKIVRAFELCFGRKPESEEIRSATEFIGKTNWQQFARAMLNTNEFVFIP
jgi:hypothetical protein